MGSPANLAATLIYKPHATPAEAALRSFDPMTLVVDDILEREAPPDLEQAMRSALGVEAA